MDETLYLIVQGVHRCVAARMVGLPAIFADVLDTDGRRVRSERVSLEQLYSPKAEIDRWDRGRDFQNLLNLMGSTTGRAGLEPVFLSELFPARLKYFTPVLDVVVKGLEEGWS
jgi:hypothetical protein